MISAFSIKHLYNHPISLVAPSQSYSLFLPLVLDLLTLESLTLNLQHYSPSTLIHLVNESSLTALNIINKGMFRKCSPEFQSYVSFCLFDMSTLVSSGYHKLKISLTKLPLFKTTQPAFFFILFANNYITSMIQIKDVEVICDSSVFLTLLIQSVRKSSWF